MQAVIKVTPSQLTTIQKKLSDQPSTTAGGRFCAPSQWTKHYRL